MDLSHSLAWFGALVSVYVHLFVPMQMPEGAESPDVDEDPIEQRMKVIIW